MLADLRQFVVSASTAGLTSDQAAAIAALRTAIADRMEPDVLDEGSDLPALTYQLISNSSAHTLDGMIDGLFTPRVQIDVWAADALTRDAISLNLKIALDGFAGSLNGNTAVDVLLWDNEINSYEPDRKQYRAMLDFKILHH